jgi:hypothetical protein
MASAGCELQCEARKGTLGQCSTVLTTTTTTAGTSLRSPGGRVSNDQHVAGRHGKIALSKGSHSPSPLQHSGCHSNHHSKSGSGLQGCSDCAGTDVKERVQAGHVECDLRNQLCPIRCRQRRCNSTAISESGREAHWHTDITAAACLNRAAGGQQARHAASSTT